MYPSAGSNAEDRPDAWLDKMSPEVPLCPASSVVVELDSSAMDELEMLVVGFLTKVGSPVYAAA